MAKIYDFSKYTDGNDFEKQKWTDKWDHQCEYFCDKMKVDEWEDRERIAITWCLTVAVFHIENADEIADNNLLTGWFGKEMEKTTGWLQMVHMALVWYGEQKGEVYNVTHTHNYLGDDLLSMWEPIFEDTA